MVLDRLPKLTQSNQVHLPTQIKKADTFAGRLLGLMFRKSLPEKEGLWIIPCNSIHMFFMRFSIDAVFLDQQCKIIKLAEHVPTWTIIPPVRNAYSTLELPAGAIKKYRLQVGDILVLD